MGSPRVPGTAGDEEEIRLLRAALEVSRHVDPAENARAIVTCGASLEGAGGGFLYVRSTGGGQHELLASHVGTDDPRRKGLLRISLESAMAEAGFCNADLETGPCPPVFAGFGFQAMVSPYGEDGDC